MTLTAAEARARLAAASEKFAQCWPLSTYIACNPLLGYEGKPFFAAMEAARTDGIWTGELSARKFAVPFRQGQVNKALLHQFFHQHVDACLPDGNKGNLDLREVLWGDLLGDLQPVTARPAPDVLRAAVATALPSHRVPPAQEFAADGLAKVQQGTSLSQWVDRLAGTGLTRRIDLLCATWCATYLDEGQATWQMPGRERGLLAAWRQLALHDPFLSSREKTYLASLLKDLPEESDAALAHVMGCLGATDAMATGILTAEMARLPGWVGYLRWRSTHPDHRRVNNAATALTDLLVLRLCYANAFLSPLVQDRFGCTATFPALVAHFSTRPDEYFVRMHAGEVADGSIAGLIRQGLWIEAAGQLSSTLQSSQKTARTNTLCERLMRITVTQSVPLDEIVQELTAGGGNLLAALDRFDDMHKARITLVALEETWRRDLLSRLIPAARTPLPSRRPPLAQAVFCIDVRSEPFRQRLESFGHIETLGFAGFFGLPVRMTEFGGAGAQDLCPVLLHPRYELGEEPAPSCQSLGHAHLQGKRRWRGTKKLLSDLKGSVAGTFGYVETFGLLYGLTAVAKTLAPQQSHRFRTALHDHVAPPVSVRPVLSSCGEGDSGLARGMTLEEQAFFGETALTMMGLRENFAPFVIFCGHGSQTENNPYAAALDCGACGGNHGGAVARVLAEILNTPAVRESLATRGIHIPAQTLFLAGEHNTTTDQVTLSLTERVTGERRADLDTITRDLEAAAFMNRQNRLSALPGSDNLIANALDWSQVRPEWGLANNAAFIVGPRGLTQGLDLHGRCFLHSYESRHDPEGKALEVILTAPLVVAEWINTQYFFSTIDNNRFGSGTKVTHNVVGKFGIVQGNTGDLQVGLPLQSVMKDDRTLYHTPMRLMAVVMAPVGTVQSIIDRHMVLKQFFNNEWVALTVIQPDTGEMVRYLPGGGWERFPDEVQQPQTEPSTLTA